MHADDPLGFLAEREITSGYRPTANPRRYPSVAHRPLVRSRRRVPILFRLLPVAVLAAIVFALVAYSEGVVAAISQSVVLVLGLCLLVLAVAFYFLPSIIAWYGNARHTAAISALNLMLGWTLLGWTGALVWALVECREVQRAPKCPTQVRVNVTTMNFLDHL